MSTPVSIPEKTSRDATDVLTVTTQAGQSYKIKNENFVQNLPTQQNPFDIGALTEISSLADGDFFPLRDATDGQDKKISKLNLESEIGGGGGGGAYPFILLKDIKSSGTDGGTFSNSAPVVRDLNTEVIDTDNICTLSGNQFTLPAGTYWIEAGAIAYRVNNHKLFVYDTDAETVIAEGQSRNSYASVYTPNDLAYLFSEIILSSEATLELWHECQTTRNSDGLGQAGSLGSQEEYAYVKIWRIS
jgi:hypothetical protein